MRFKVGFILRGILIIVTFLLLAVLWSALNKLSAGNHFGAREGTTMCQLPNSSPIRSRPSSNKPEPPGVPDGPGEGAKPFVLGPEYKETVHASIKEFGFNMVASDMISLDRTMRDIRHEECKYWHYDERLLTSSVVIVFHNEGWSTLMRTIHSVIKRTPRKYLAEIVMIDDFSNKVHLKERLEMYVKQWNGLVKLYRNEKREGLIQARSIGAKKATEGQVLIYLDAHCEVGVNWYAPLVAPISEDRTVCTVPLIDAIHGETFTIEPQGGGDEDGFARGAWDWSMLWKRVPLNEKEKKLRKTRTEPYRSPAMAGGLFAIERDYFFELGLYDPGLQIWGGENFEISYKIWQCGGQLLFVPCSRVGHIYRLQGWQGNPPPAHVGSSPTLKNYVRVVEVWWDEYKDYFYASRPETLTLAYGDISELKQFRQEHRCKSFKWFMEEIAYDIPLHYPLPPKNVEWGEIRGFETSYCIDSMGHTNGGNVETGPCHRMGGNQLFRINEANQLMQYDQCLTRGGDNSAVIITHCDQNHYTEWRYFKNLHRFTHVPTGKTRNVEMMSNAPRMTLETKTKPVPRTFVAQGARAGSQLSWRHRPLRGRCKPLRWRHQSPRWRRQVWGRRRVREEIGWLED
ncbi:N-acetylgalactosaminyltransferase 7 isoform X3 [Vanacampus margaritifer]